MEIYRQFLQISRKLVIFLLILFIKIYKYFISPITPVSCKYYPSCSSYAIEALKTHNLARGIWLLTSRIFRCNPFCRRDYYDPVPKSEKVNQ